MTIIIAVMVTIHKNVTCINKKLTPPLIEKKFRTFMWSNVMKGVSMEI